MLGDTIVALASPPGSSERAVLRLSGPRARDAAALVFTEPLPDCRAQVEGAVRVRAGTVPALALVMVAPASFTGEDTVELHVPGGPLLVQVLQEDLLARGAGFGLRLALPGEFTARACQNGRLDLAQAEGLLMLLHAADRHEAAAAVQWLQGGLSAAVVGLRGQLQDVLALFEVGLDFADGEAGELDAGHWQVPLLAAGERIAALLATIPIAAPGGEVLLLGVANAGKSSLCNALLGRAAILVDATAGTTRDLLRVELAPGVVLWDAPGDLAAPSPLDADALALRDRLAGRATAVMGVLDASDPQVPPSLLATSLPVLAIVWTHGDLVAEAPPLPAALASRVPAATPVFPTSAVDGRGLPPLRAFLVARARAGGVTAGAPLREALQQVAAAVERALQVAPRGPELAAVELQAALRALDGVDGHHSPEHLLDRIYGRFCLGK